MDDYELARELAAESFYIGFATGVLIMSIVAGACLHFIKKRLKEIINEELTHYNK